MRTWLKTHWVPIAVGTVAFLIGIAVGTAGNEDTTQLKADVAAARDQVRAAQTDADRRVLEAERKIDATYASVDQAQNERKAELDAREAELDARASAIAVGEAEQAARQVNDGVHEVGRDIEPGTYRTAGSPDCYWAILADPNGNDIIANDNVDGPAIVQLAAGQYFESSSRCATWTRDP